jgi:hypothetical protein
MGVSQNSGIGFILGTEQMPVIGVQLENSQDEVKIYHCLKEVGEQAVIQVWSSLSRR